MPNVIIADDEPLSLKRMEIALGCIPEVRLVGKAATGTEALTLIRRVRPEIALLDIEMPGRSGLEVAAQLTPDEHIPEIIFVSGFEEHALRAFELNAVDYLLKPAPFERIRVSIRRAQQRLRSRTSDARFAELEEMISSLTAARMKRGDRDYQSEIWVRDDAGLMRIPAIDVDLFEAAGDYVIAHVGTRTYFLNDSISNLQANLNPDELFRIHRSSIVNLSRIRNLRKRGQRYYSVVLVTGMQRPVGPKFSKALLRAVDARRWQ